MKKFQKHMTMSVFFFSSIVTNRWMSRDTFHYVSCSFFLFICNQVHVQLVYMWCVECRGSSMMIRPRQWIKHKNTNSQIPIDCLLNVIGGRTDNLITFVLDQLVMSSVAEWSISSEFKLRNYDEQFSNNQTFHQVIHLTFLSVISVVIFPIRRKNLFFDYYYYICSILGTRFGV